MARCMAFVSVAVVILGALGCSQAPRDVVGAWELVSESTADSTQAGIPDPLVAVKVLSEGRFAFGRMTAAGEVWAGGGLYSYDGHGHYSEFITYHSMPELVGRRIDFTCRLEGDLWYHDGSAAVEGGRVEIHEVWGRIRGRPGALPDVPPSPGGEPPASGHAWAQARAG